MGSRDQPGTVAMAAPGGFLFSLLPPRCALPDQEQVQGEGTCPQPLLSWLSLAPCSVQQDRLWHSLPSCPQPQVSRGQGQWLVGEGEWEVLSMGREEVPPAGEEDTYPI